MKPYQTKPIEFIRELCKDKSEDEILEAQERFMRYLDLVKRICERLEREEQEREIDNSPSL